MSKHPTSPSLQDDVNVSSLQNHIHHHHLQNAPHLPLLATVTLKSLPMIVQGHHRTHIEMKPCPKEAVGPRQHVLAGARKPNPKIMDGEGKVEQKVR
jgi:hypothetical protein